jgi:hypothetical protein
MIQLRSLLEQQARIDKKMVNGLLVYIPMFRGERMGAFRLKPRGEDWQIESVMLYDRYRGRGVGKAVYQYIIRDLKPKRVYSDRAQTGPAKAIWQGLVAQGQAEPIGSSEYVSSINEITFGQSDPYAVSFNWHRHNATYEAEVSIDGELEVTIAFYPDIYAGGRSYSFSFSSNDKHRQVRKTVTHDRSELTGRINYIRLMHTMARAIVDFIKKYDVDEIDVTGADSMEDKEEQKTRLYLHFLRANERELNQLGYTYTTVGGRLTIIKKSK